MKMKYVVASVIGLMAYSLTANAGLYTDDLSRCMVEKTSKEDRAALVRWMFVAAAAHPAVAPIAKVSTEQQDGANKAIGELFTRLLTGSCKEKAKSAIAYEGGAAIQMSFQVLGQVAGAELFQSPEVARVMAGLEKHVDKKKLDALGKQ
jgi:hypothetical protein